MTKKPHSLSVTSAKDAYQIMRKNDLKRYPHPDRDGSRLYPQAQPVPKASFQFDETSSIFALGSCFARNIENTLSELGMDVLSRNFDFGPIGAHMTHQGNLFNKYSIHSILNELTWALEPETHPGEALIYRGEDGAYFDLQLGMGRLEYSLDEIRAFRAHYTASIAQIIHADVIILTLGYVETWYDKELGHYLNIAPPAQLIKRYPDRFSFHVQSYDQTLEALQDIYALLLRHRVKPLRILTTVSPVPLLNTFRDMDVLSANSYSKSVQRAALEQFTQTSAGVDYFPSYETVTMSDPNLAWARDDYRHVSPYLVVHIMRSVIDSYFPQTTPETTAALHLAEVTAKAQLLNNREDWDGLWAWLQQHSDLIDQRVDLLVMLANCFRNQDAYQETFDTLIQAWEMAPERYAILERLIWLTRPLDLPDQARAFLALHKDLFGDRHEKFREKITWIS
ncbi:hypothetical protein GCM10007939_01240 [Amylibacter marinus]|uniref:GSCFA domain-containing protein n=1 Tax=Amylibacter marinus TaxID=1475483 RepID=A0ABQ5VR11_9RHOB|nr:GSCFA domain-containing protein [Amylibacter marinus]GLQ33841.1 hypothetical protein GCM10007939_01240 [Amylibacter marinus]